MVSSPEPETEITTSYESVLLSLSVLMPLSITYSVTIPGMSSVSRLTDVVMSHSAQSYPVTLAGLSNISNVTDLGLKRISNLVFE